MIRVAVSDLHLGYDESLLTQPKAGKRLAQAILDIANGQVDELVLNGDIFEGCVPKDASQKNAWGLSPAVMEASQALFVPLGGYVGKTVWVAGNHDLDMASKPLDYTMLFGPSLKVKKVYPVYYASEPEGVITFHHGHFLDPLVLGIDSEAKYATIAVMCGALKPQVPVGDYIPLYQMAQLTSPFVRKVWAYDSEVRRIEWEFIRRYTTEGGNCLCTPDGGEARNVIGESFWGSLDRNKAWFTQQVIMDPDSPAMGKKNYLVLGHDHGGGQNSYASLGYDFTALNSGGWVKAKGCETPHCHVIVFQDMEATMWCVDVV